MKAENKEISHDRPTLVVRKIAFSLQDKINPVWNPRFHEWSHMVNGASLTMPYLEPFLIRNVREAASLVTDGELKKEMRAFNAQEGQHFQHHQRYNDMLKDNGYAQLRSIEEQMAADFSQLQDRSLQWRLAYTAGFETMTVGVTEWLVNDRRHLFGGADANVCSFVLWHMVEETEHKNVAIDLYNHLYPKAYFRRVKGVFIATAHIVKYSRRAYILMLKKDGLWNKLSSRLKLWKMVARFGIRISPAMFRSLLPGYHPSKVEDPTWVQEWVESYASLDKGFVPLLDTMDPDIKPTFS